MAPNPSAQHAGRALRKPAAGSSAVQTTFPGSPTPRDPAGPAPPGRLQNRPRTSPSPPPLTDPPLAAGAHGLGASPHSYRHQELGTIITSNSHTKPNHRGPCCYQAGTTLGSPGGQSVCLHHVDNASIAEGAQEKPGRVCLQHSRFRCLLLGNARMRTASLVRHMRKCWQAPGTASTAPQVPDDPQGSGPPACCRRRGLHGPPQALCSGTAFPRGHSSPPAGWSSTLKPHLPGGPPRPQAAL